MIAQMDWLADHFSAKASLALSCFLLWFWCWTLARHLLRISARLAALERRVAEVDGPELGRG